MNSDEHRLLNRNAQNTKRLHSLFMKWVLVGVILVEGTKERRQGSDGRMIQPDFRHFRVGVPDLAAAGFSGKIYVELDDVFE